MIKVAFVIDEIISPNAGTEKQLLLLLAHLDRSRFLPFLCVLRSSEWIDKEFTLCPVRTLDIRSFKDAQTYYTLWSFSEFLQREEVDIVQTYFRDGSLAGITAARLAGVRRIIATRRNQGYWLNKRELLLQRFLNKWVSLFITNSHTTKEWMSRTEKVSKDKIHVIHNGIAEEFFLLPSLDMRKRTREEFAIPDTSPVIGVVANLRKIKGIDVFLHAATLIKERSHDARFIIVGKGPERDPLMSLAQELGLHDCVHFLGERDEVRSMLSCLDVAVLPSCSESSSNALIEYVAAGLPVVCTEVGGSSEIVEDGVNGFIVPCGDAGALAARVIAVLEGNLSPLSIEQKREEARTKFASLKMVRAHEQLYESLCAKKDDPKDLAGQCTIFNAYHP